MPRSHVVMSVFQRNFSSFFAGLVGYLFIVLFVMFGAMFAFGSTFFSNNQATFDQLTDKFPFLLLFMAPAITMSVWAEERKQGTEELLFTMPVSDLEVLLGKYLAVVAVYSVVLAFSLVHVAVLATIGDPDPGVLFANYLSYWLAGCALLSIGMTASYLTNNSTVAFALGGAMCAAPVLLDSLPWPSVLTTWFGPELREQVLGFSIGRQLAQFSRGEIPWGSVFYFVSIVVLFLYINLVLIGRRHWAGGQRANEMGWHFLARAACIAVAFVSLNRLVSAYLIQADLTAERLYTLTPTTTKILKELDANRPVTVQAFVSRDVPRDYVPVKKQLLGMLAKYRQASGNNVIVRVVEVDPFSPESDQARQAGVEPRKVQSEVEGQVRVDDVYLGTVVSSGAQEVAMPFIDVAIPIEYELTRSIRTVAGEKRRKIGILETDAKIMGGFDVGSMRNSSEWRIVTELKKQYDVEAVPATGPIDGNKYDVLIAILPSSLNEQAMQNFLTYTKTGKPVLVFDDPIPAFNPQLSPSQPKPRPGGMMGGMGAPPEQKADGGRNMQLCALLDVEWKHDSVVWDTTVLQLHPLYADVIRPEMVAVSKAGFSAKSEISKGLQEILAFFAGTVVQRENSKLKFEPLLNTSKDSGLLAWSQLVSNSFFGIEIKDNPRRVLDPYAHTIAAHITSEGSASGPKLNVIFVADSDLISDWFFMVRERRMHGLDLDNVTFVLNAVDELAGDRAFIDLRKRRAKARTLNKVEEATKVFRERADSEREKASAAAETALEEARTRLSEQVKKIDEDTSSDEVTKDQLKAIAEREQQRKLEVVQAKTDQEKERRLDEIKAQTERQIQSVRSNFSTMATILPPIPAIALGLMVWMKRRQDEQRAIQSTRRRAA